MPAEPTATWVEIGVIGRAHGLRGWVRVKLHQPGSRLLSTLDEIALDAPARRVRLLAAEEDAAGYRLRLEGVTDRDQAEALQGVRVLAERQRFPAPGDDEVYLSDLVGCELFDLDGQRLGRITGSYPAGPQDVLLVDRAGEEILVPLAPGIVREIDLVARRITCDPPEGLLELNLAPRGPRR